MVLSQLRQEGIVISGYFIVGPALIGSGNFTGQVTADKHIQFLVATGGRILPLFFEGQIQPNGSISGTYCSYEHNQCNYSGGGYGTWNVFP